MADAVKRNPRARQLLATGEAEVSIWFRDDETGVMLRARADWVQWIDEHTAILVDLKTTPKPTPSAFRKSVAAFGYHRQQPWYQAAFASRGVNTAYVLLVVSEEPPHVVYTVELKESAVELGARDNRRAIDIYARCLESGEWPDDGDLIHEIDVPAWEYKREDHAQ
jgi:hypothetical protein